MERKAISDKARFLLLLFLWLATLTATAIARYTSHETLGSWLKYSFAPITLGPVIVFLGFYLAMRIKQRVLKMPEGL